MWNRIGAWVIALVVGIVYGAAGSIGQASTLWDLPAGLVVSVVGAAALVVAMRALTGDRWVALAGGLGMIAATALLSSTSPGGSVLFTTANEVQSLVWMAAVPLVTAVAVAWPDLRRRPAAAPR